MESQLKNAVIYCRVSTKEQVEEGNSLVTQEKNCNDYASKHGYNVVETFIELGESAKTAERTQLQKLFSFCAKKQNNISAVITYKIDRLSRNTDDYSQMRLLLKKYDVEIKSTSEYFENTPAGRFMENIIANVAQFDNDVRTERSIGGMRQAVMEGRYVWLPPLGYSNVKVNGKSTIAANEKAIGIKETFQLIATKKMTPEQTRKYMAAFGVCQKNGNPLCKSHFYTLLSNRLYTGIIQKFGEEVRGKFVPIIDDSLFNLTQMALKRKYSNRQYQIENADFPLRRFIVDPDGKALSGCWCKGRSNKYPYYRLGNTGKMLRKEKVESAFIGFLNSFSIRKNYIDKIWKTISGGINTQLKTRQVSLSKYEVMEQGLREKQNILIDKNLIGTINDDVLKDQLEIIEKELFDVRSVRDKLLSAQRINLDFEFISSRLNNFFSKPGSFWSNQPFHIKRLLQRFDFPDGVVFDGENFRTTKICNIFRLINDDFEQNSAYVHSVGHSIKPLDIPSSGPEFISDLTERLHLIQSDLAELDKILATKPDENLSKVLQLKPRLLKEAG